MLTQNQFNFWTKGWSFRTRHARYERLGVTQQRRLPVSGTDWYPLHGVCIRVLPLTEKRTDARKSHRLVAACPGCSKVLSAGRIFQHLKACQELEVVNE